MSIVHQTLKEHEDRKMEELSLPLSKLCENLFLIIRAGTHEKFSFQGRNAWEPIYNDGSLNLLVAAGRQVGKSTYLGNRSLILCSMIETYKLLYVSPTHMQTAMFSHDRLHVPTLQSRSISLLKGTNINDSVLLKRFRSGSTITLRYAYRTAGRIRGLSMDEVDIDEFQDILMDLVPIIEETLSASRIRRKLYAGTFSGYENALTYYYFNESNQNEWLIPCGRHGFTHWNIINSMRNIGKGSLICEKCSKPINPNDTKAHWRPMDLLSRTKKTFVGWRLPQVIMPCVWPEVLDKARRYPPYQFFNEVLALPYDIGNRPISREDLLKNCKSDITMQELQNKRGPQFYINLSRATPTFAGIDWGSSANSYTVLTIGGYGGRDKFTFFYLKRFTGVEAEPEEQIKSMLQLLMKFNVKLVGVDFGFGFGMNDRLARAYGIQRVFPFQYVNSVDNVCKWNREAGRFQVDRTAAMAALFSALIRGTVIELPNVDEFYDPFGKDILNIYCEYSKALKKMKYDHSPDSPDDTFHAMLFCFMVSMMMRPRQDFIYPIDLKELE